MIEINRDWARRSGVDLGAEAVRLAGLGWPVGPLHEVTREGACTCARGAGCGRRTGKHPRTDHGYKDFTTDVDKVRDFWRALPTANVAVATGSTSKLILVDTDERNQGELGLRSFEERYGQLPPSVQAITGGGFHRLFRYEGTDIRSRSALAGVSGVDIKAEDGFAVVAPSIHYSGARYRWVEGSSPFDIPPVDLPEAWISLLRNPPRTRAQTPFTGLVQDGQRHQYLIDRGRTLRMAGASQREINAALLVANAESCDQQNDPPDEDEISGIAEWAGRLVVPAPQRSWSLGGAISGRPADATARLVRLSSVRPASVEWVWPGYLPKGKMTVLDGDPGLGKSTVALDIAARVTRGREMPNGDSEDNPGSVLYLTAEDGLADTIRPRLDAAGGDATMVHAVDVESDWRPSIPGDIDLLSEWVREFGIRLVVIDPFVAHLDGHVNSNNDQDVRRALAPLAAFAEQTGVAVLLIRHFRKAGADVVVHRGGGSIGIIGAARSGLMVAQNPDDETRRVLACTKSNLGAAPDSLGYRVVGSEFNGAATITWEGVAPFLAADLFPRGSENTARIDDAREFLKTSLATGPKPANWCYDEAERNGIRKRTLERAKAQLNVHVEKGAGFGSDGGWMWQLELPLEPDSNQPTPKDRQPKHGGL